MKPDAWLIRISNWLLSKIYDEELYDEIEGDMLELYTERLKSKGKTKASLLYLWDTILSMRNIGLKRKVARVTFLDLLLANSRFALRIFLKDKFFASLNILGLALGIAMSIVVMLVLHYDFTYDKHYANYDRIFRLSTHFTAANIDQRTAKSSRVLPDKLAEELPEIEAITRIFRLQKTLLKMSAHGSEVSFYENGIVRADSNYFKVFKSEFIAGNEKSALREPFHLVITESTAKRYFGSENPLGKTFSTEVPGQLLMVTGVIQDHPENTHLKFNIIMSGLEQERLESRPPNTPVLSQDYWDASVYTYMLMPQYYDPQSFLDKWPLVYNKHYKPYGEQLAAMYTPILQRLDEIHFYSKLDYDEPAGNIAFSYAFATIGGLIILLACINYMNLSTAKYSKRASEVGMKKVLGLDKRSLSFSFLTESVILSLISLLIGLAIVLMLLSSDAFRSLLERDLTSVLFGNPVFLCVALITAIAIGLFSGIYPALYLSNIPVITAIKGTFGNRSSINFFRKGLTLVQFSVSIIVVVCTLLMQDQIYFLGSMNLGFEKENVMVIPIKGYQVRSQIQSMKRELLQNPNIIGISTSGNVLGTNTFIDGAMMAERYDNMEQQRVNIMAVGEDYFKTMGIDFKAGSEFPNGADAIDLYICNEAASRLMGWGDNPVGKKVKSFGSKSDGNIIGMVKDFNYSSLYNSIQPLLIVKSAEEGGNLHVRIAGNRIVEAMELIENKWRFYYPDQPFDYFFLDQRFQEHYKSDIIQQKLASWLSYICMFISFLGIVGLSAFNAEQRSKEIGIRKILGASVTRIIFMMSRDVLLLVMLSALVVLPITQIVFTQWLQTFAYRISINYLIHVAVIVCALAAVFVVVFLQSFKAASSNPVEVLKAE